MNALATHERRYGRKADTATSGKEADKTPDNKTDQSKDTKAAADAGQEIQAETLGKLIREQVEAGIRGAKLSVDTEVLTKIVSEEVQKAFGAGKLTTDAITNAARNAVTAVLESNRTKSKDLAEQSDANNRGGEDRNQIEIPYSLCKGNLTLHHKQLVNALLRKDVDFGIDAKDLSRGKSLGDQMWSRIPSHGVKALTTSGDGTGSEFMPRLLSDELYRRLFLESQIAQTFLASEVQMPSNPYDYPLLTTNPTFVLNNVENTVPSASDLGTSKFTLTAQRLMALCQLSYEANEDSIIPLLPTIQQKLAQAGAIALENALINGDTTSTHFYTGAAVASNDVRRAWKGLRRLAQDGSLKSDWSTGGISRANTVKLLALLGKYAVRTQDLVWIVGTKAWANLLNLDEVALAYARGSAGTYTQGGPTPAPWGGSIAVSEAVAENLNASGVWDNSTTSKGQILVFSKSGFVFGTKREFTVEVDRNIKSQTHDIVVSFRKAFQPIETPSASIPTVAQAYNYTA